MVDFLVRGCRPDSLLKGPRFFKKLTQLANVKRAIILMLNEKRVLITGGTGSFGNAFVPMTLEKYKPAELIVFSRDEIKQWEMAMRFSDDAR